MLNSIVITVGLAVASVPLTNGPEGLPSPWPHAPQATAASEVPGPSTLPAGERASENGRSRQALTLAFTHSEMADDPGQGGADQPEAEPYLFAGDRIRVLAPSLGGKLTVGTVRAVSGDDLFLELEDRVVRLDLGSIARLDVASGTRSRAKLGALVGALVGASFAYVTMPALAQLETGGGGGPTAWVVTNAGVWAGLGALIGHQYSTETWRPVPISGIGVHATPAHGGGFRAALSFRF